MATSRGKIDNPDGITAAELAGTANRYASRRPVDVAAALAELREIAGDRSDLLAEQAGLLLGARAATHAENWPALVVQAALLVLAGADIEKLPAAVSLGMERATLIR